MVNCSQHRVYGLGNCLDTALLYTYLATYLVGTLPYAKTETIPRSSSGW